MGSTASSSSSSSSSSSFTSSDDREGEGGGGASPPRLASVALVHSISRLFWPGRTAGGEGSLRRRPSESEEGGGEPQFLPRSRAKRGGRGPEKILRGERKVFPPHFQLLKASFVVLPRERSHFQAVFALALLSERSSSSRPDEHAPTGPAKRSLQRGRAHYYSVLHTTPTKQVPGKEEDLSRQSLPQLYSRGKYGLACSLARLLAASLMKLKCLVSRMEVSPSARPPVCVLVPERAER